MWLRILCFLGEGLMATTENKDFSQDVDKVIKHQKMHLPSSLQGLKNQMCFILDQFELQQLFVMKSCNWWGRAEGESFQPLYTRWKAAQSRLRVLVRQIWYQKYSYIKDSAVSCCRVAQTQSPECEPQHLSETTVVGDHLDVIRIVFQTAAWISTEGCTQTTVYEPAAVYRHK